MASRNYVVPIRDLDDGPKNVEFELEDAFLRLALDGTEATWSGPGSLKLEIAKVGGQVMVRGRASVDVTLPCARTLEPVIVPLRPEIFLMLTKVSEPAAPARPKARKSRRAPKAGAAEKPAGKKKGYQPWEDDPELGDDDASFDTFEGEELVLDPFVREFLLLDLPMVPVSSDLPTGAIPAIPRPPAESGEKPVDPRLAPLAAIAARMRKDDQ